MRKVNKSQEKNDEEQMDEEKKPEIFMVMKTKLKNQTTKIW